MFNVDMSATPRPQWLFPIMQVKEAALKLYKRGTELAEKQGLIFIDTKYEFGIDEVPIYRNPPCDAIQTPP